MNYVREPVLQPVPIESLRPTQITVGMREVEEKHKRLSKAEAAEDWRVHRTEAGCTMHRENR
jgi:hypothetical protein